MTIQMHAIKNRTRQDDIQFVRAQDFELTYEQSVSEDVLIDNPNISLYCLDPDKQHMLFVEIPSEVDLSQVTFHYQGQYQYAQKVYTVPYETFHRLATRIDTDASKLILLYSAPRCGSTLLTNVLNHPDCVTGYSEPDIFTQLFILYKKGYFTDDEMAQLVKNSIAFLMKPTHLGYPDFYMLKFRSYGLELGKWIDDAYPEAKSVFIYRNSENSVKSGIRAFAPDHHDEIAYLVDSQVYNYYLNAIDEQNDMAVRIGRNLLTWLSPLTAYLDRHQHGHQFCALRYEEMVAEPIDMIGQLFAYCGLPAETVAPACSVFNNDSQAGSSLSRQAVAKVGVVLPDEAKLKRTLQSILDQHPQVQSPAYILPDTITPRHYIQFDKEALLDIALG
ncbi:MAG: sulfotransferase [Chloroflexota bacterium]